MRVSKIRLETFRSLAVFIFALLALLALLVTTVSFWSARISSRSARAALAAANNYRGQPARSASAVAAWVPGSPGSVIILPQNAGGALLRGFNLRVRFPEHAEIVDLDSGVFDVVEGGKRKSFVVLEWRGILHPGSVLPPISVRGEIGGHEIGPEEVVAWSNDEPPPTR